jgi:hypothetical protein
MSADGSNGIVDTGWDVVCPSLILFRLEDGRPLLATLVKFGPIVSPGTSSVALFNVKPFFNGPTIHFYKIELSNRYLLL